MSRPFFGGKGQFPVHSPITVLVRLGPPKAPLSPDRLGCLPWAKSVGPKRKGFFLRQPIQYTVRCWLQNYMCQGSSFGLSAWVIHLHFVVEIPRRIARVYISCCYLGMVIQPFGIVIMCIIKPYYWIDDHSLSQGNKGKSLDLSTDDHMILWCLQGKVRLSKIRIPHTMHVWYICLHFVDLYGKCR